MRQLVVIVGLALGAGAAVVFGQGAVTAPTGAAVAVPPSPLDAVRFLAGTWRGEASGEPGRGSGSASFTFDLGGRVLVRRSHSDYPAAAGTPAAGHDDLMVIYPAPGGSGLEAMYFDNEGHVIEYAVAASVDGRRVVFTSEVEPGTPTFRLTYARVAEDVVDVTFEIAPPGAPGAFKTYVSGRTRRDEHGS
jgi:hypothetical protein